MKCHWFRPNAEINEDRILIRVGCGQVHELDAKYQGYTGSVLYPLTGLQATLSVWRAVN